MGGRGDLNVVTRWTIAMGRVAKARDDQMVRRELLLFATSRGDTMFTQSNGI